MSPILWALLDQIIITALPEIFSIRLVAYDGVKEHIRSGDSFLDDTTCGATGEDVTIEPVAISAMDVMEPEELLVEWMEEIIQFFLDLLHVMGGT